MSYFASSAPSAQGQVDPGAYQELDDQVEETRHPRSGVAADGVDTSGDEALARALAAEINSADGAPQARETLRDEEVALALSLALEEEERAARGDGGPDDERPPPTPPKPRTKSYVGQASPKPVVDAPGITQSMFDRLMAPFRRRSSSASDAAVDEARRARAERFNERRLRQATVVTNVMEVYVPDFLTTENFLVFKPDGSASRIHVPLAWQRPAFYITYEGEPLITSPPRILDDTEQNAAFLDYYRFNPFEVEAEVDLIPGPRTLGGLELVSQPEGVFVKWGVMPLPPSRRSTVHTDEYENEEGDSEEDEYMAEEMEVFEKNHIVCAGDLIVQVGDVPTTSLESLRTQLASMRMGSKVNVRVLRKPPPEVRCPMGHLLHQDDPRAPVASECNSCRTAFGQYHCTLCGFSLCPGCHHVIYSHSKSRFPRPVNNDHEFTEAPQSERLLFSTADVGVRILIFWYTTAEWWIGRIESFDPLKGHTVVYEERNGSKCKEIVPDFSVREYRILTNCVLAEDEESAQTKQALAQSALESDGNPGHSTGADLLDFTHDDAEESRTSAVESGDQSAPLFSMKASPSRVAIAGDLLEMDAPLLSAASQDSVKSSAKVVDEEDDAPSEDKVVLSADELALVQGILGQEASSDAEEGPP